MEFVINPNGYTYQPGKDKDVCAIGINNSPGEEHFRLGMTFLRNFYTGLDFDNNKIILGVNKNAANEDKASLT